MDVVIVTGLSGAGKSLAADCFEDLGYYCIDNLPPSLIKEFTELIRQRAVKVDKAAFVVDIRGGESFDDIQASLKELKARGVTCRVLFLDASSQALLSRFSESRRSHPLASGITNEEALEMERSQLEPIRRLADYTVDTTGLKNAELLQQIRGLFSQETASSNFRFIIESFGYKYSIPLDADFVFDMRFIPNPYYVASLRNLTGNSKKVQNYVMRSQDARDFLEEVLRLLKTLKPAFVREGKNTLCVAFGCTGGQHRSVTMANLVSERLTAAGEDVTLLHRDR
jgi:UPF0042 nucleotide-binding protein